MLANLGMKWLVLAYTLTVAILIAALLAQAEPWLARAAFLAALAALLAVLGRGVWLIRTLARGEAGPLAGFGLAHILAHAIPLAYLVTAQTGGVDTALNLAYLLPLLVFFYSGRRLWRMLHARFGTPLYRFFAFGNTGLLNGLMLLSALGLLWPQTFAPEVFATVLRAYFAAHFLLTGVAVLRIDLDLRRA
jgi:hypothetical protein